MKFAICCCLLASLSAITTTKNGNQVNDSADTDAIRELVVRDLMKDHRNHKLLVFIECENHSDPTEALMKRLADSKLRIRKASKARKLPLRLAKDRMYFDRETKEPGVMVSIQEFRRIGDNEVELQGRYTEGPKSGFGDTYRVGKKAGKLVILHKSDHIEY